MTARTAVADRPLPRIGFSATLASEWAKLWTVRSTWISIGLALLLSIGLAAMLGGVIGATIDEWSEAERAAFDPVLFSFAGTIFSLILLSVLAVMYVSAEYSSGMIRLTLTVTPRRGRILAAKVVIIAGVTLVVGSIATIGMFAVSQAIFEANDLPTVAAADPDALRAIAGIGLTSPVFPVIGVALGFILRSTAGAITGVLGVPFLPEFLGPLLPAWWQENVLAYLPGAASDAISIGHLEPSPYALDPALAVAVVIAWVIAFVGLAYLGLLRRDA